MHFYSRIHPQVTALQQWQQLAEQFQVPPHERSGAQRLQHAYEKLLIEYESTYFFQNSRLLNANGPPEPAGAAGANASMDTEQARRDFRFPTFNFQTAAAQNNGRGTPQLQSGGSTVANGQTQANGLPSRGHAAPGRHMTALCTSGHQPPAAASGMRGGTFSVDSQFDSGLHITLKLGEQEFAGEGAAHE